MKPEVQQSIERFESASRDGEMGHGADSATGMADRWALKIIRKEMERLSAVEIEYIAHLRAQVADAQHVHYLGGHGHGGTIVV